MAELKTKITESSVKEFITSIDNDTQQQDCLTLVELFSQITKEEPKMWGSSIIGFGMYHYKSTRSSQEGDWPLVAFSPRKHNLSLYLTVSGYDKYTTLLSKLGKHKLGKGCLYINRLSDINQTVLEELISQVFSESKQSLL